MLLNMKMEFVLCKKIGTMYMKTEQGDGFMEVG